MIDVLAVPYIRLLYVLYKFIYFNQLRWPPPIVAIGISRSIPIDISHAIVTTIETYIGKFPSLII